MSDLRQYVRRFLQSEIQAGELADMNAEYGLNLSPGASFLDALATRAAQLAEGSERWAQLARQFERIRGGGDG